MDPESLPLTPLCLRAAAGAACWLMWLAGWVLAVNASRAAVQPPPGYTPLNSFEDILAAERRNYESRLPEHLRTNSPYVEIVLAERRTNVAEIYRLLPEVDKLWPAERDGYVGVMVAISGWVISASRNGAEPNMAEVWGMRSNLLSKVLDKGWLPEEDSDGAPSYFGGMQRIIVNCAFNRRAGDEPLPPPLLIRLAEWAGNIRSNMIPMATIRQKDSTFEAYLAKVAWKTYAPSETNRLPEATRRVDSLAIAAVLRKRDDPAALRAAERLSVPEGIGLDPSARRLIVAVRYQQEWLREANWEIIESDIMRQCALFPPGIPDNKAMLDEVARAAHLLPEERKKIGLDEQVGR